MSKKHVWVVAGIVILLLLVFIGWNIYRANQLARRVDVAMQLEPGWNLANTLDAYGMGYGADSPTAYETYWGSATVTQAQIHTIANAGFHSLRLPVTWFEHMDTQGKIDSIWLDRVQTIVDWALDEGLYVILNAHHDRWYEPDPTKEAYAQTMLCTTWRQIATRFATYDDRLLYESMNEPRLIDTPEEWTAGTPEARAVVNRLNAAFVQTIRQSGQQNASRYLLLPTYAASILTEALEAVSLPMDEHILLSVHLYVPYSFALDVTGTSDWSADRLTDTLEIQTVMQTLTHWINTHTYPVVITEFGALDKTNETARAAWVGFIRELAAQSRIPCLWWDSAMLDTNLLTWRYPALLTALTR